MPTHKGKYFDGIVHGKLLLCPVAGSLPGLPRDSQSKDFWERKGKPTTIPWRAAQKPIATKYGIHCSPMVKLGERNKVGETHFHLTAPKNSSMVRVLFHPPNRVEGRGSFFSITCRPLPPLQPLVRNVKGISFKNTSILMVGWFPSPRHLKIQSINTVRMADCFPFARVG